MTNENESLINGVLSKEEHDTIGEMTSIAMGAACSTLGILLGQEVEISAPKVQEYASLAEMDIPFGDAPKALIQVQYTKGIQATTLFIIKNADAAKLAEMMLGSTAEDGGGETLSDLQTSGVSELMNQMMNSAATGIASIIHETVEVNNPEVMAYSSDILAERMPQILSESFIASHMELKIGGEAPIELIELRVAADVKNHVNQLMSIEPEAMGAGSLGELDAGSLSLEDIEESMPAEPAMASAAPRPSSPASQSQGGAAMNVDPVMVRPVEFSSFDNQPNVFGEENKNLELVMDVTLNLTVELGKTELSIKDVLELTRGSVIELDRVAGEPVDLMANGKLIAKGEVVVIEDNFGLRITSIVSPADRLRGL